METANIKLRSDLVLSRQAAGDAVIWVLKDPMSGRFFRFKEIEGFLLQQLNGNNSLETIRKNTEEQFQLSLPVETLQTFVNQLRQPGLLEDQQDRPQSSRPQQKRIQGDMFYLRFRFFDPDRLFDVLIKRLGFFFTRGFVVCSAASVILALYITFFEWSEIQTSFLNFLWTIPLLSAWVIVISVVFCHEFAHGLACKRFGGHVHDLGFLLIYFMPAFYCNISDAWLFPEKSKRLWVTFAGAYFEIFLWSLATLLWRISEQGNAVNTAALVVMATSGIKTLFNMNPLIKLDGYYLLSDYIEIPNLRARAFRYMRERLTGIFRHTSQWIRETSPREQRIYILYGIFASIYTTWLLSTFAVRFGEYLFVEYQGWGLLFFSFFLFGMLRYPMKRLLSSFTSSNGGETGGTFINTLRKRKKTIVVVLALAAILFFVPMQLTVTGPFVILPEHNADVRAEVEETIAEVFVDEGDTLRAGDPIVRLSDRSMNAELQKVEAEVAEAEAKLKLLKAGPRREEITLAKTLVAKAEERLAFAQKELERMTALYNRQLLSQKEYEQAKELVAIREKEFQEEQSKLKVLQAGSRPEEIEALEAELNSLLAQQRYVESQLQRLLVTSPRAGIVVTRKLHQRIGELMKKGDLIAKVHELEAVTVEITVSEKDISNVSLGQEVAVKARAFPQNDFTGLVTSIAPLANIQNEWDTERTVLVTAQLGEDASVLKSGMSGNAKIYCGDRKVGEILFRKFINFIRVDVWSWW